MADMEQIENLRAMLAERIPPGGSEADTLFASSELERILNTNGGNLERAAYDGWRIKAAEFANLVSVTDGAASREFSDLHKNALEMVKTYMRSSAGPTEGRTRVGRIRRAT
jgi:hypothetical protein